MHELSEEAGIESTLSPDSSRATVFAIAGLAIGVVLCVAANYLHESLPDSTIALSALCSLAFMGFFALPAAAGPRSSSLKIALCPLGIAVVGFNLWVAARVASADSEPGNLRTAGAALAAITVFLGAIAVRSLFGSRPVARTLFWGLGLSLVPIELFRAIPANERWQGLWGDPNTYGCVAALWSLSTIQFSTGKWRFFSQYKWARPLAFGGSSIPVLMSGSRGALLGLLAGGALWLTTFWKDRKTGISGAFPCWWWSLPSALAVCALAAVICPYFPRRILLLASSADVSNSNRLEAWFATGRLFLLHPLAGWGDCRTDLTYYIWAMPEQIFNPGAVVTNDPICIAINYGSVGLISFLAIVWHSTGKRQPTSEAESQEDRAFEWLRRSSLLTLLIVCTADGFLFRGSAAFLAWLYLGIGG